MALLIMTRKKKKKKKKTKKTKKKTKKMKERETMILSISPLPPQARRPLQSPLHSYSQ